MIIELHHDLYASLSPWSAAVAGDARIPRTAAALEANGISVLRAANV